MYLWQHPHPNTQHHNQRLQGCLSLWVDYDTGLHCTRCHFQRQRLGQGQKLMGRFLKPCLECGQLSHGNRCPTHQQRIDQLNDLRRQQIKKETKQYSGTYKQLAKIVRANALTCHICGEGPRYADPWEADHLTPSTQVNTLADLAPAHRSCNARRGNNPL